MTLLKLKLLVVTNIVIDALSFNKKVLLATVFLMTVYIINAEIPMFSFERNDTYQRYQCMASSTGKQPLIVCSLLCLQQSSCIGVFHDTVSSECLIINRTEKIENCSYSYPSTWRAYKKRTEIGKGACNLNLINTYGFIYFKTDYDDNDRKGLLNYVPRSSEEIGGIYLDANKPFYMLVCLDRDRKIIGVATQGRWRNDSLESCCDERLTSFRLSYWNGSDWVIYLTFVANVIPDSGNEVVYNFFPKPITASFFYLHPKGYHLRAVFRIDFIGC